MLTMVEVVTLTSAITLVVSELCTILLTAKALSTTVLGNMSRKGTGSDTRRNLTQLPWKKIEIASQKVKTISTLNSREKWDWLRTTNI
jgi:hypothetical protein